MTVIFTINNSDDEFINLKVISEIQEFIQERFRGVVHVLIQSSKIGQDCTIPPYVDIEGNPRPKLKKVPHYKTLEKK